MSCSKQPWRIISDGQTLYVVDGDVVLKILDPRLMSYNMATPHDIQELTIMGDHHTTMVAGLSSFDFSFDVKGVGVESIESSDVLLEFFHSASIRDLLGEINKKIEARG